LRALAIIYLFLAGIVIVGGIATMIWMLIWAPYPMTDRVILAAASLAGSVFGGALLLGAAEIIKLFVDLERNTRMAWQDRSATGQPPAGDKRLSILHEETAEAALIRGH
jgi:hypothetical protein